MGNAGLIFSGMAASAGNAAVKSLNDLQHTWSEDWLNKERARLDDLRLQRMQDFAASENEKTRALTREEGAAGRKVTQEEGAATRGTQILTTGMGIASHEKLSAENNQLQRDLSQDNILSREKLTADQLRQADEHFQQTIGLQKEQVGLEREKLKQAGIHPLPLADGTVAIYSAVGGKPQVLGLLNGSDGKPLHVPGDLTKRDQALVHAYVTKITDNSRELRDPLRSEEEKRLLRAEQTELLGKIETIAGRGPMPTTPIKDPFKVATAAQLQTYADKYTGGDLAKAREQARKAGFTLPGEPITSAQTNKRQAARGLLNTGLAP